MTENKKVILVFPRMPENNFGGSVSPGLLSIAGTVSHLHPDLDINIWDERRRKYMRLRRPLSMHYRWLRPICIAMRTKVTINCSQTRAAARWDAVSVPSISLRGKKSAPVRWMTYCMKWKKEDCLTVLREYRFRSQVTISDIHPRNGNCCADYGTGSTGKRFPGSHRLALKR